MSDKLFCVWAYRMSNTQSYNFPVGLFSTLENAQKAAENHRMFRGGKYGHLIYEMKIGQEYDAEEFKPVLNLLK